MSSTETTGPDPVWGLGVFVVGLVVMATGGANTWHWVFNVGEALLLLGIAWFLIAVAVTATRQRPLAIKSRLPRWLGGRGEDD